MNIFVLAFAVIAATTVAALPSEYLSPVQEIGAPIEYAEQQIEEQPFILADDGYRYKTVKKLRHRHRRDISEISDEYLPPAEETSFEIEPQEPLILAEDGYRYKTVKKLRLRHRRDVGQGFSEYQSPVEEINFEELPLEASLLADDGYRYRTVKKLRHRRDVGEISSEYLPPVEEGELFEGIAEEPAFDDGYRYKTVRKLKYRYRH